jgi:hypothetical protein
LPTRTKLKAAPSTVLLVLQFVQQFGLHHGSYSWCRDLRRYSTVPHCGFGFGLGFERLVVYVCGLSNFAMRFLIRACRVRRIFSSRWFELGWVVGLGAITSTVSGETVLVTWGG